jgi:mono/diheme cytochrome c family protein
VANVKLRLSLAVVLTAFVAGCGGGDDNEGTATPASGGGGGDAKTLFVENCGNCHTLAAAGTSGKVGPDMDQLRPGPDLVNAQVTNGGGGMPAFKGKLTPEQITELANYVADNAGKG